MKAEDKLWASEHITKCIGDIFSGSYLDRFLTLWSLPSRNNSMGSKIPTANNVIFYPCLKNGDQFYNKISPLYFAETFNKWNLKYEYATNRTWKMLWEVYHYCYYFYLKYFGPKCRSINASSPSGRHFNPDGQVGLQRMSYDWARVQRSAVGLFEHCVNDIKKHR